jgi:hypothetical protein
MSSRYEDIDQLAAYTAVQHTSFQKLITGHCRKLVEDTEYYETFKADLYQNQALISQVSAFRMDFSINASPEAAKIKMALTSLLDKAEEERRPHIYTLLKAEVVYRESDALAEKKRRNGPN